MRFNIAAVLFALCFFVVGTASAQTIEGGGPSSPIAHVPTDHGTIQSGIDSGATVVLIEPGYYRENLTIPSYATVMLATWTLGDVVIDGGDYQTTISSRLGANLMLFNLVVVNSHRQGKVDYNQAAVFAEFGGSLRMARCNVFSRSIGISTNYLEETYISETKFVGYNDLEGNIATGLFLANQNMVGPNKGARVLASEFNNLRVGIDSSSSYYPPETSGNRFARVGFNEVVRAK